MNYPGMCLMEIDDFRPLVGDDLGGNLGSGEASSTAAVVRHAGARRHFSEGFCRTAKGTPNGGKYRSRRSWTIGQTHRLLVVSREISERKKSQDERERILLTNRRREKRRGGHRLSLRLWQRFSHELRTPLLRYSGWRDYKRRNAGREHCSQSGRYDIKSSELRNRLIEDLLDVRFLYR